MDVVEALDNAFMQDQAREAGRELYLNKQFDVGTKISPTKGRCLIARRTFREGGKLNFVVTLALDEHTHLTVSIMNKRLLAMSNMDAMMDLDWIALSLCALVVGLTVSGEIKDIALCEIAAQRKVEELR